MADGYFGLYSATVRNNTDPNGIGGLQVSAPQIFDPEETVWARPLLPHGHFFIPDVGDLIWLQFEGGELDNPVWVGIQVLNGGWSVSAPGGDPTVRSIRSPAGHVVIMRDTAGAETMEIFSPTRLTIRAAGAIEINAPTVTVNGRPVAPLPSSFTI